MDTIVFDFATLWDNVVEMLKPDATSPLVFSSGLFWVLMIIFLPIYGALRNKRAQMMLFVVAFSLLFAFRNSGWYFGAMVLTSVVDWWIARRMAASESKTERKTLLWVSLLCSVGLLFLFKYTDFFLLTWAEVVGGNFQPLHILAPAGLSFYTFRTISYVVDVYQRRIDATDSYLDYLFFLSFFPCLLAGPIVRAKEFMPQLHSEREVTREEVYSGFWQVMVGVLKKAVVADYLAQYTDIVFGNPSGYSGFELLMAALGFTMQLYCDFAGYSDMAIGLGRMMGFDLGVNFDFPLRSTNITEFWRRWHISLSFWLRDYVYIPLGGNRKGKFRQYLNCLITMLVGGFWHGAGLKFIWWGAIHGVALVVHKANMPWLKKLPDNFGVKFLSWLLTFATVVLAFVTFRADSAADAWLIMKGIFTNFDFAYAPPFASVRTTWCVMMMLIFALHFVPKKVYAAVENWFVGSLWLSKLFVFMLVVQLVIEFSSADVKPFIYAQF